MSAEAPSVDPEAARLAALESCKSECSELSDEVIANALGIARAIAGINFDTNTGEFVLADPFTGSAEGNTLRLPANLITDAGVARQVVDRYVFLSNNGNIDIDTDSGEIYYMPNVDTDDETLITADRLQAILFDANTPGSIQDYQAFVANPVTLGNVAPVATPVTTGEPLSADAEDLLPPTEDDDAVTTALAVEPKAPTGAEELSPPELNKASLEVVKATFETSGISDALNTQASITKEIDDTIKYATKDVPTQYANDLVEAANRYVQNEFTSGRIDPDGGGISQVDWSLWRKNFESQLETFLDDPTQIQVYLEANPSLYDNNIMQVTPESTRAVYEASGVYDLLMASIPEDAEKVMQLGVAQKLSSQMVQELGQLVGMISAAITQSQAHIDAGRTISNYQQISVNELSEIKLRILSGYNILEDPVRLSDVNQRINSLSDIVQAYVSPDAEKLAAPEIAAQAGRLTQFINGYKAANLNRFPSEIATAEAALVQGDIDGAVTALKPIVDSALRSDVLGMALSLQFSDAEMADGETVIDARLISQSDEALMQALRYIKSFDAAGTIAMKSSAEMDGRISTHIETYVQKHQAEYQANAQSQIQRTLDQMEIKDPVGFQVMTEQIKAQGGIAFLTNDLAQNMAAAKGFRGFMEENSDVADLPVFAELYADMEGIGWFDFSDSTVDLGAGILAALLTSGPFFARGLIQGASRVASLAGKTRLVTGGKAFIQSNSGLLTSAAQRSVTTLGRLPASMTGITQRLGLSQAVTIEGQTFARGAEVTYVTKGGNTVTKYVVGRSPNGGIVLSHNPVDESLLGRFVSNNRAINQTFGFAVDDPALLRGIAPATRSVAPVRITTVAPRVATASPADDTLSIVSRTEDRIIQPTAPRLARTPIIDDAPTVLGRAPVVGDNIATTGLRAPTVERGVTLPRTKPRSVTPTRQVPSRIAAQIPGKPPTILGRAPTVGDDLATAGLRTPITPTEKLTEVARHGTPTEFREILTRTAPSRPVMSLSDDTLKNIQVAARANPARLAPAIDEALVTVENVTISAISPTRASDLFARIPGLTAASRERISQGVVRATAPGRARVGTWLDDLAQSIRTLPRAQQQTVVATMVAAPFVAPIITDSLSALLPGTASAGADDTPSNRTTPILSSPNLASMTPSVDTSPAEAVSAPDAEIEVEEPQTLAEQMEAITSNEIRGKAAEIKAVLANHTSYSPGDWQQISDEIATLYGLKLATEEDRTAFGHQIQNQIRATLGIAETNEDLSDGKIGRETMQHLDRAMISVSQTEITAQTEALQNFEAQNGGWRANNRAMAKMFGIDLSEASNAQLKTFGRSIQAFAGGTDGAIGSRTIARLKERLTTNDA